MPVEVLVVAIGGALVLVHVFAAAIPRALAAPEWAAGPRDGEPPAVSDRARRADRARVNILETYPVFVAAALAVVVAGVSSWWTEAAAVVWLIARVLYLPAYVFAVPLVRTAIWGASLAAIVVLIVAVIAGWASPPAVP